MSLIHWISWSKFLLKSHRINLQWFCIEFEFWKHICTSKTAYKLISQWTEQYRSTPKLPWESDHERNQNFGRTSETICLQYTRYSHIIKYQQDTLEWLPFSISNHSISNTHTHPHTHARTHTHTHTHTHTLAHQAFLILLWHYGAQMHLWKCLI